MLHIPAVMVFWGCARSLVGQSTGLLSRGARVRIAPGAPLSFLPLSCYHLSVDTTNTRKLGALMLAEHQSRKLAYAGSIPVPSSTHPSSPSQQRH